MALDDAKRRGIFSRCHVRHEPILLTLSLHITITLPPPLAPFRTLL